jgi:hypothetical protein
MKPRYSLRSILLSLAIIALVVGPLCNPNSYSVAFTAVVALCVIPFAFTAAVVSASHRAFWVGTAAMMVLSFSSVGGYFRPLMGDVEPFSAVAMVVQEKLFASLTNRYVTDARQILLSEFILVVSLCFGFVCERLLGAGLAKGVPADKAGAS